MVLLGPQVAARRRVSIRCTVHQIGWRRRTSNFCPPRRAPRRHTRRHARPAPPPPRPTVPLRASTPRCRAAVDCAPQRLRGPQPRAHTGVARQQVHLDPGAAPGPDTAAGAEAAIAAAGEPPGAEGRVPEGRHHQAQEAQLGRAQDRQGASEHGEGHHRIHPRRRYVVAQWEAAGTVG